MKKFSYLVSTALIAWFVASPAFAATTQHITGTVDPSVPSVSVVLNDTTVSFGLSLGATNASPTPDDVFVATNDGTVLETFNIRGTDATGGGQETWTLTTGSPATNTYNLSAANIGLTNANSSFTSFLIPRDPTNQTLAYNVQPNNSGSVSFKLRMNAPTASGTLGSRSFSVIIQAVGQ